MVLYGFVCTDDSQEKRAVFAHTPDLNSDTKLDKLKTVILSLSENKATLNWKVTENIEDHLLMSLLSALRILAMTNEDI